MLFFLPGPNCPEVWLLFLAGFLVDVGNPEAPLSQKHESHSLHQCLLLVRFVGFQITQTTNCLENSRFCWKNHYMPKRITMVCRNHLNTDSFFVPSWYGFQKCHPQQWWSPLSSVVMTLQTDGRKIIQLPPWLAWHWGIGDFFYRSCLNTGKIQLILVPLNRGSPS